SELQGYLDSWVKNNFYIKKIFKDADINITKQESESLNNPVNTLSLYKLIKRVIGSKPTNLKDFSKDKLNQFNSSSQEDDFIILDSNFNEKH
ncbi:5727_t:CDS:1, partial [Racocetra fulgida]